MDPVGFDERRPLVIVGEDRTAVAVASDRLGREEGGGGDIAEGAGTVRWPVGAGHDVLRHSRLVRESPYTTPKALGAVFQDQETILVSDGADGLVVRRKAEKVNGDNRPRLQPTFGKDLLDGPI